ncbi:MAG: Spo0B domain-containing protein [Gallintestinimicrobium sp.]
MFLEVTICSCIFLINIIFGSLLHYPSDILFFNGILIFCFATANVLIFLMLYNTLQANKKLELQAREQENLTHYMAQLENHYQDIRRFKHDYLNILSTITGYIQENDMDKLRNYFDSSIVTSSKHSGQSGRHPCASVADQGDGDQGSLYTKMVQAMNRQLDVSFELTQETRTFH